MKAFLAAIADFFEDWMIESGLLDQLAFLTSNTTLVRGFVLAAGSYWVGKEWEKSNVGQVLLGVAVTVLIGTVNQFIAYVRNKHAHALQVAVGATPDKFIGPETVTTVRDIIADAAVTKAGLQALTAAQPATAP